MGRLSPHPAAHFIRVDPPPPGGNYILYNSPPGEGNKVQNLAYRSMLALEPADMLLGVELKPDPPDQVELGFEEVNVVLLVLHQALEQIARDVILDAVAVGRGFLVKIAR